jgi:hypothetical protein
MELSDLYGTLSDIHQEGGRFKEAVEEMKRALAFAERISPPDLRL